jgi:hypothetical protein
MNDFRLIPSEVVLMFPQTEHSFAEDVSFYGTINNGEPITSTALR